MTSSRRPSNALPASPSLCNRPRPTERVWPALMSAATAAQYLGERSARAFCRRVGKEYPKAATRISGRGKVWRKTDLDDYLASLGSGPSGALKDIADVL